MRRSALNLTIGLGSPLAELGGFLAQLGTEVEHWGLRRQGMDGVVRSTNKVLKAYGVKPLDVVNGSRRPSFIP